MFDLGLWLDAGAAILPLLLGVAGVALTIEAPKLESDRSRLWWRAGLVAFSLLTSGIVLAQQYYARQETTAQLALNYVPSVAVTIQADQFIIENHGRSDVSFWGTKIDTGLRDMTAQGRVIAPGSNYGHLEE